MTSNVDFHKQLRRTVTGRAHLADHAARRPDSRTPLLDAQDTELDQPDTFQYYLFRRYTNRSLHSSRARVRWLATAWHTTKVVLLSSYLNVLLVFFPVGLVAAFSSWSPSAVFALNFLAIIPLAGILSFATEEVAEKLGDLWGGVLNATFGNAVELIVSIVALKNGQVEVVKSSMLGSIISDLLLVLGLCFMLGGIYNMTDAQGNGAEQTFASSMGQISSTLMALSSASMIVPAAMYAVLDNMNEDEDQIQAKILQVSRGTAIVLFTLYILYLVFQLRTHKNLFSVPTDNGASEDLGEASEPHLSSWAATGVMLVVTVGVSLSADALVDSIDAVVEESGIGRSFIGLILIPIVGNATEHVTACVVAMKNKMDLAIGVVIGASIQIALLVTPFLVLLGWAIDQPMSFHFQLFEVAAFALTVLVVSYMLQDGKANYLEGAMLLGLYIIIALAIWAIPSH